MQAIANLCMMIILQNKQHYWPHNAILEEKQDPHVLHIRRNHFF